MWRQCEEVPQMPLLHGVLSWAILHPLLKGEVSQNVLLAKSRSLSRFQQLSVKCTDEDWVKVAKETNEFFWTSFLQTSCQLVFVVWYLLGVGPSFTEAMLWSLWT